MPKKASFKLRTILILLLLFVLLAGTVLLRRKPSAEMKQDLNLFATEEYQAAFLSMYPIENYNMDDFANYRGLITRSADGTLSIQDFSRYFNAIFSSGNQIDRIYLGIDPEAVWKQSFSQSFLWNRTLNKQLLLFMDTFPQVTFEVLLPYPKLSYWTALSEQDLNEILTTYRTLGAVVNARPNAVVHFIGSEEWLIANPANYEQDSFTTVPYTDHKLTLLNFCDAVYQMDDTRLADALEHLKELVASEKASPSVYPDLSDRCYVFFGDSVMAYETGATSIPGVVNAFGGASVYCLSQGGMPAANPSPATSLAAMCRGVIEQNPDILLSANDYTEGLHNYLQDVSSGKLDGKHLVFVIYMGLNDYFNGFAADNSENPFDISTYGGALRNCISSLQAYAPEASFLLMSPNYVDAFSRGTEITSSVGSPLTTYVDTMQSIAAEYHTGFINVYEESGITEATQEGFLADGIHPNDAGRLMIGRMILDYEAAHPQNP